MSTHFDAAKFIQTIEGMGAELKAVRLPDGSGQVFPKYGLRANKARIDALWKQEVEPYPDRLAAVARALLERERRR